MNCKQPKFLVLLIFVAFCCSAHDLWLEKQQNIVKLLYGHKHSSHGGDAYMEYEPNFVKEIYCWANGKVSLISFEKKYPVEIKEDCQAAFVLFSSGYWTKTVYGTKNVSKENEKNVVKSWYSEESVKYIDKWDENLAKPFTNYLEIVPLVNLSKVKIGDKIRLLITFRGKPRSNVVVAYKDEPKGSTDDEGKINIRIKEPGFQIITASLNQPADGIKADEIIYTTNLNFIVEK